MASPVIGVGARTQLAYLFETDYGTTPAGPSLIVLRETGNTLDAARSVLANAELVADRMTRDVRLGAQDVAGDINGILSYLTYDSLIEAALGGTWVPAVSDGPHADVTMAAVDKSYRSAALMSLASLKVGDRVTVSGCTTPGNNGIKTVVTKGALYITVAEAVTDEAPGASVTIASERGTLKAGTTRRYLEFEVGHLDINQFRLFKGCEINQMQITARPNELATVRFGVVGQEMSVSGATLDASPDAANTFGVMATWDAVVKEGGGAIANVSAFDMTLDNNITKSYVLGAKGARMTAEGRSAITGTISATFEDADLLDKFLNETETSLELTLKGLPATQQLAIKLGAMKYTGGRVQVTSEGALAIDLPFSAYYLAADASNIVISRDPAAA